MADGQGRARSFINAFDSAHDRMALLTFGNGAQRPRPDAGGPRVQQDRDDGRRAQPLPGGSTHMVEGLYRGWDELRSVPTGTQSGLRIIVLFTDGASNGVPGKWGASGTREGAPNGRLPERADPDDQTWDQPPRRRRSDEQHRRQ